MYAGVDGVKITAGRVSEAKDLIGRALNWLVYDGGCQYDLIRRCLLELSCISVAGQSAGQAAALLRAVRGTVNKQQILQLSSHVLQPASVSAFPSWLTDWLKSQQQFAGAAKQLPGNKGHSAAVPTGDMVSPISDAVMGRLAVCHYARLMSFQGADTGYCQSKHTAAAQLLALHGPMKLSCAKFVSDCCWEDVPLPPPGETPAVTPGKSNSISIVS